MDFLTSPVYDVAHFHTVLEILTTFEHITQDTLFNISLCYSRMGNGLSWNSFFWLVTILHNCITVTFLLSTIALNTICLEQSVFIYIILQALIFILHFWIADKSFGPRPLMARLTKPVTSPNSTVLYKKNIRNHMELINTHNRLFCFSLLNEKKKNTKNF